MLRRLLLAGICLAAVIFLGGCVVDGHGSGGVHAKTPHHSRVYNIRERSYPHTHYGQPVHSHANGNGAHSHGKPAKKDQNYPPRHRGYHEQGDRGKHNRQDEYKHDDDDDNRGHGNRKGHRKSKNKD